MEISINMKILRPLLLISLCIILSSCSSGKKKKSYRPDRAGRFERVNFSEMPMWKKDKHLDAFRVFQKSCRKILENGSSCNISSSTELGSEARDWFPVCNAALKADIDNSMLARVFFERWFTPYRAKNKDKSDNGKFTGYYEISMRGSRHRTSRYKYPIYRAPHNLPKLKGSPELSHSAINNGSLKGKGLEIAWVDNKARLFFMQIQGSGVVLLENGGVIKLSYNGENGYSYKAIGPEFRKYKTGKISSALDMIEWLHKNPKTAKKIMEQNQSYVFFREVKNGASGPIGAQSIGLTEHRSIAVDKYFYPYGTPVWIDTTLPKTRHYPAKRFTRLHIAQDTGGAIRGPVRADLFFGRGRKAEQRACYMNQHGTMYALFPKTADIPTYYKTAH